MTRFPRSLAAALLALPAAAWAQSPSPAPREVPAFGTTTELVYLRFHIEKKGALVGDVKPEQIRVLEDGQPQTVAVLETSQTRERTVPPEVTLVLDVSSSVMDARLLDETLVKDVLFAGLGAQARVGLCAFGATLVCPSAPGQDPAAILAGFRDAIRFGRETRHQGTRLYASLADIARQKGTGKAKRALIVFSDGLDNLKGKVGDAIKAAEEADVRVYAIKLAQGFSEAGGRPFGGTPDRAMYDYKKLDLDQLADATGGRAYEPAALDEEKLAEILASIASEIALENVVGYEPRGPATGAKRKVKVELVDKSLGKVRDGERTIVR